MPASVRKNGQIADYEQLDPGSQWDSFCVRVCVRVAAEEGDKNAETNRYADSFYSI